MRRRGKILVSVAVLLCVMVSAAGASELSEIYDRSVALVFDDKNYEEALTSLQTLIDQIESINPSFRDDIYYMQAKSFEGLEKWEEAEAAIEKALSGTPEDEYNYDYYLLLLIDASIENGKEMKARQTYDTAIRLFPDWVPLYRRLSNMYSNKREYGKAIDICNQGLARNPGDLEIIRMLSHQYSLAGRLSEAIDGYTTLIGSDSESKDYYYLDRAELYYKKGNLEAALSDMNSFIDNVSFTLSMDYEFRGDIYRDMGNTRKALADYEKAWDKDSAMTTNWELAQKMGDLYLELEKWELASDIYNVAVIWADDDALSHIYRGMGYAEAQQGYYNSALIDYDDAIDLAEWDGELYLERSQVHGALGNYEQAISDLDYYIYWIELPNSEELMQRGYLKYQMGDVSGAIDDYKLAREVDPWNNTILSDMGKLYQAQGMHEQAVQTFTEFLSHCFADTYYWTYEMYLRAYSYFMLGKDEEALADLNMLTDLDESQYEPFYLRAQFYQSNGKIEEALKDYQHIYTLMNSNAATAQQAAQVLTLIEELKKQI